MIIPVLGVECLFVECDDLTKNPCECWDFIETESKCDKLKYISEKTQTQKFPYDESDLHMSDFIHD